MGVVVGVVVVVDVVAVSISVIVSPSSQNPHALAHCLYISCGLVSHSLSFITQKISRSAHSDSKKDKHIALIWNKQS